VRSVRFSASGSPFPLEWRDPMAKKKPRTPTPPRVQAPQRRSTPKDPIDRHRAILYGVAGLGIVGLVVAVLLVVVAGGSGAGDAKAVARDMAAAGCSYRNVKAYVPPGQGTHVNSLTKKLPWNTDPPSNGQHYPLWAVWGFWTEAQNPRQVVHNEEHGGVVLWWGSKVPQSTVDKLHAFYNEEPVGLFGTPYPSLGSKFAITAWTGDTSRYQRDNYYGEGHIGICSAYTPAVEKAFTSFRKAFRGHGPEGIPLCADHPGDSPNKSSC
jgi:hypothetical protein